MTENEFIRVMEILVFISVLIWFIRYPWQKYLVDLTRQRLFEVRDNLFLMATDGKIDFNSEVYIQLRKRINISIKYTHLVRTSNLAAFFIATENLEPVEFGSKSMREVIDGIEDQELCSELNKLVVDVLFSLAILMVFRSIFMSLVMMITLPLYSIKELLDGHFDKLKTVLKRLFAKLGSYIEKDIFIGSTS